MTRGSGSGTIPNRRCCVLLKEDLVRAAFAMWRNTRMIILTAVCAAIYGAALLAFKTAIPFVPGITELRVANLFPTAFGLLFGPAGAWGTALGNLLGDLFGGTLGPGSLAGLAGNFLLGYLPYTLWQTLLPFRRPFAEWTPRSGRDGVNYAVISFISSAACAVVISAFVDALGIVPFAVLSKIITFNNTLASWVGVLLLSAVFRVTRDQLGLLWTDVMDEETVGRPRAGTLGAWIVLLSTLVGLLGSFVSALPAATLGWLGTAGILLGCLFL
jgi:energy-coupling factor transport system substrate-specific component